jgi:maltose alpha-D-glucosyltransferase/alpha-amylase
MVVSRCEITDVAPLRLDDCDVYFLIVRVETRGAIGETISLLLAFVPEETTEELLAPQETAAFARISGPEPGVLCDALAVPGCCRGLLRGILGGRLQPVEEGEIEAAPVGHRASPAVDGATDLPLLLRLDERYETAVLYGESFILKTFRRTEEGVNPDVEVGRYLALQDDYDGVAPVAGCIEYRRRGAEPITLGVLHGFVPNQGTAWQFTLDQLSQFFESVATVSRETPPAPSGLSSAPGDGKADLHAELLGELIGGYLENMRILGLRTAELHHRLAADRTDPAFTPKPFGKLYQRSIYQSFRNLTGRVCERLAQHRRMLAPAAKPLAETIIRGQDAIMERFRRVLEPSLAGQRIRCHGDLHLGHLLHTGKDFVIIDFEGDRATTIGERRVKRSPLRDVASLIRSLDYAVQSVLLGVTDVRGRPPGMIRDEDRPTLEPWAFSWYDHVTREFLSAYFTAIRPLDLLPRTDSACYDLLELMLLEQAFFEVDAELTERPEWVIIPLRGAVRLLGNDPADPALLL